MMKNCSRCSRCLPLTSEFYQVNKQSKTGFRPDCKDCRAKLYREKNPDIRDGSNFRACDGIKICRICMTAKSIESFGSRSRSVDSLSTECKSCYREMTRNRRNNNKEKFDAASKRYKAKNPEKVRAAAREYARKRRAEDGVFRFRGAISRLVSGYLKRRGYSKTTKFFEAVGYTKKQLIDHMEKQFKDGMSWENYGKWHIDHIVPNSSFNYQSMDCKDFKECWSLSNLRPSWANENQAKSNAHVFLL